MSGRLARRVPLRPADAMHGTLGRGLFFQLVDVAVFDLAHKIVAMKQIRGSSGNRRALTAKHSGRAFQDNTDPKNT